jgi:hypothetical protein
MTQEKFNELSKKWKEETAFHSSMSADLENESAKEIIKAGLDVLPFIIDEIRKTYNGHYCIILSQITGVNPITEKHSGKIKHMAKDWIKWYDKKEVRSLIKKWKASGYLDDLTEHPDLNEMAKLLEGEKVQKINDNR